jgi:hypothetical protein
MREKQIDKFQIDSTSRAGTGMFNSTISNKAKKKQENEPI